MLAIPKCSTRIQNVEYIQSNTTNSH